MNKRALWLLATASLKAGTSRYGSERRYTIGVMGYPEYIEPRKGK